MHAGKVWVRPQGWREGLSGATNAHEKIKLVKNLFHSYDVRVTRGVHAKLKKGLLVFKSV